MPPTLSNVIGLGHRFEGHYNPRCVCCGLSVIQVAAHLQPCTPITKPVPAKAESVLAKVKAS